MKKPKISVIMAVYNEAEYLQGSISSVLNQTFGDFEFIIIDDGSEDDSLKIIKKFAQKDRRIKIIPNPKNRGLTFSLNQGLKQAQGKYIARQDGDDISLPKRFAIQYNYLEKNPQVFLVGTSAIIINKKGQKIGCYQKRNEPRKIAHRLASHNQIIHSSFFFRNNQIYYREKFIYAQDYDFLLRLLSRQKTITNSPHFLIKYRYRPQSISFLDRQKQKIFARKASAFYKQRVKQGQDNYPSFNPKRILNLIESNNRMLWSVKRKLILLHDLHLKWRQIWQSKI